MKEASLIYPHQLFADNPVLKKDRPVYLIEESLFLTEFPTHTQKLLLHHLSMQAYRERLEGEGYQVSYLDVREYTDTALVFAKIAGDGVTKLHIVDTTDMWLEARIARAAAVHHFEMMRYESPLFILSKKESVERYLKSKKHMASFYKKLRRDKDVLMDGEVPRGGKWSFDEDNRKKLPKKLILPADIRAQAPDAEIRSAQAWLCTVHGEHYGDAIVWVPWTHEGANAYLKEFLAERLGNFGDYEDAISSAHVRLFHSTLSPLINCGLLLPGDVLESAMRYGREHAVALNTIEGFVRQILGWREFIRASYECDGVTMRTKNFWGHTRPLPKGVWDATTGIVPLDATIHSALRYGYNHHIERLMVLGNFFLLSRTNPHQVYRWFMALYVDAYDWVMVPNVYGMSQFADGGIFATKPYISGSSYVRKMSDYGPGEWEIVWTALYWTFIKTQRDFFLSNHRLSMMPKLLEKMDTKKLENYMKIATDYLE